MKQKQRIPSFPDKILINPKHLTDAKFYGALSNVYGNDHRPVIRRCKWGTVTVCMMTWNVGDCTSKKLQLLLRTYLHTCRKNVPDNLIVICLQECYNIPTEADWCVWTKEVFQTDYNASTSDLGLDFGTVHKKICAVVLSNIEYLRCEFTPLSTDNTRALEFMKGFFPSNFPAMLVQIENTHSCGDTKRNTKTPSKVLSILSCHAPVVDENWGDVMEDWFRKITEQLTQLDHTSYPLSAICGDLNSRIHFSRDSFPTKDYVFMGDLQEREYFEDPNTKQSMQWAKFMQYDSMTGSFHNKNTYAQTISKYLKELLDLLDTDTLNDKRHTKYAAPSYPCIVNDAGYIHLPDISKRSDGAIPRTKSKRRRSDGDIPNTRTKSKRRRSRGGRQSKRKYLGSSIARFWS